MSSDEKPAEAAQFLEAVKGLEAALARRQAEVPPPVTPRPSPPVVDNPAHYAAAIC
jgi:hypothetical protein